VPALLLFSCGTLAIVVVLFPGGPALTTRTANQYTFGKYEAAENILHLWYPQRVQLSDEATVIALFEDVETRWIRPCPLKPYLLVNYANVHLAASMAAVYAERIRRFRPLVIETFRYGVAPDFTGVAVALGNLKLAARANIFPDEATAREAILRYKSGLPE
jgi:hypothetical protein